MNCRDLVVIIDTVMNKTYNINQQQVLELLKSRCKKVELFDNKENMNLLPDTYVCLLEDQKIIEVTFSSEEDKVCVSYYETDEELDNQEYFDTCELDDSYIDRMFEIVANDTVERLQHVRNKAYADRVQEFLS